MVTSSTILIKHEIFNPEKRTTKVAMSKLYYVPKMQICLFSTRKILQFRSRVESNKSSSTFYNKSGNAVPLATPNL